MGQSHIEDRRDRAVLAREAGLGRVSGFSGLAGALAAYGAAGVLLSAAGGVATAINGGTDFSAVGRSALEYPTVAVVAAALFCSYLFGGYVAGRMARRAGVSNGALVFGIGVVIAAAATLWTWAAGGTHVLVQDLRTVGAATTWHAWRAPALLGGAATLALMLVGSLIGGAWGEHWHTRLVARALDPEVGPEARLRREADAHQRAADDARAAAARQVASGRVTDDRERGAEVRPADDDGVGGDEADDAAARSSDAGGSGAEGLRGRVTRVRRNERRVAVRR
jgi:hypothetical protein